MLQCPHCGHRTFEADRTLSTRVHLTGLASGAYRQEEMPLYDARTWQNLECCQCGQTCDEDAARQVFEEGSGDYFDDDVYDWYAEHTTAYPQQAHPAHESALSLAAAWQFWRWQQERGYGSPTSDTKEAQ